MKLRGILESARTLRMVGLKYHTYTYQLVEELSYRGVHEQLLSP